MLQAILQRTRPRLPNRIILVQRIQILQLMPLLMPPNLRKRMPQTTLHILIPLTIMPMSQSLKTLPLMTTKQWAMIILITITLFKKILMRWLWSQQILSILWTVFGMIHMCSTLKATLQMMMMSIITSVSIKGIITTTIPIWQVTRSKKMRLRTKPLILIIMKTFTMELAPQNLLLIHGIAANQTIQTTLRPVGLTQLMLSAHKDPNRLMISSWGLEELAKKLTRFLQPWTVQTVREKNLRAAACPSWKRQMKLIAMQ